MTDPKPLAKSLHTLSVLVRLARYIKASSGDRIGNGQALGEAVAVLGYPTGDDLSDPHGLLSKALAALDA